MKSSVLKSAFLPSVPSYALVAVSLLTFTGCSSGDGDGFSDDVDGLSQKKVSIDLVNPPCAEPGAVSGYIEGNGFGAENVTITVGGIEAEVLAATGHDASFVVPEGIPAGPIEVIVTNPGGRLATINWVTCELDCTPTGPELCDGIDNDCNDLIDDGIADIVSGTDVGECEFETQSCVGGVFTVVQAGVGPSPELCDTLDNDCNGADDDGIADIVSGTDVGVCEVETQSCVGGTFTVVQPGVGPSPESCDGLDNDCNGADDDGIADLVSGTDVGECEFETQSCVGGIFTVVQAGVGPSPELCDALDNDCNGLEDDGIPEILTGTDVGECEPQIETCVSGAFVISQFAVGPSPESCDSLDNDCNGSDDDGIADVVSGTDVGECEFETQSCVGGIFTVVQAGVGPSPELCDALDNDCNGAADDGVADIVSGTDVGECEFETQSCVGGVLTVVDAGVGPSPELCDALDNDCNGSVDDDPTCPEGCGEIEVCDNGLDDECDGALDDEDGCGLLPGPGNELAVSHIRKVTTPTPPISDVAGFDDRIPGAHLSMLALKVSPVATVSEFNQLITSFDARIVNGSPASGWLRIAFAPVSSSVALNQIQTQLTASSAVSFTALITRPTPDRLPDNYSAPLDLVEADQLAHHLAVRAPASWNAAALLPDAASNRVAVFVYDQFGNGALSKDLFAPQVHPSFFGSSSHPDTHGYHVLGILGARHTAGASPAQLVTGMFPGSTITGGLADQLASAGRAHVLDRVEALVGSGRKVVLNISLGRFCPKAAYRAPIFADQCEDPWEPEGCRPSCVDSTGGDPPGCIQDSARHPVDGPPECTFPGKPEGCQPSCKDGAGTTPPGCFDEECEIEDYRDSDYQNTVGASAIEWIDEINGRGLSNGPLLIVVSSGNALLPPSEAVFTSTYVHAGLGASPITGFSGGVLEVRDPLTNTIAVESRDRAYIDPATDEVRALGRDQGDGTIGGGGSNQIGQLSGIGVDVYSTLDGSFAAGLESGTSMAAPQVAGLATYVWSLDSNLQADQVMQILTDTANTIPGGPPIIDAYAAVLTVDNPPPYSSVVVATARVRGAVMDENEDSLFDAADIEAFVNAFSAATPGEYDYSRWDLNGDGKTGGCDTAPFNLDISEPKDIKSVEQIVEGQPKQYPESAVMDQDVLCYYAYSDLYDLGSEVAGVDSDGNPVDACERRRLLDGICHNAGPCVTPATTTKSAEPMAATQALVPAGICSTGGKPEIVFQSLRDGNNEIYVMDADGSNQVNLTEDPASDITPSWLPDGRIGFSSNRDGVRDIYVMDAIVSDPEVPPVNLTTSSVSDLSWPAWSPSDAPDGARITMDLVNGLGRDIYVMNADGSPFPEDGEERKNLTKDPSATSTISSWSPDGTRIAFASAREGDFEIYVMDFVVNPDGTDPRGVNVQNLTNNSASDNAPSWSPDGTRIAFWSDRGSNRDIYVMNADGSGLARLTDDPGRDTSPTWSPDGQKIAFRSQRDGDSEIYVMDFVTDPDGFNPRGENLKNLTENSASDTNPRWSPLP